MAAETLGLPVEAITVNIGDSKYPPDGASGGSTTVGGVSASTRRGSVDALDQLFAVVAPSLGVPADQLVAVGGNIQAKGDCLEETDLEGSLRQAAGENHSGHRQESRCSKCKLGDSGVGGVQIADVSVDTETGLVKINKMVAVQDCGLIIDLKTAESQCLRRPDHGHHLRAVRRKNHGPDHGAHAE